MNLKNKSDLSQWRGLSETGLTLRPPQARSCWLPPKLPCATRGEERGSLNARLQSGRPEPTLQLEDGELGEGGLCKAGKMPEILSRRQRRYMNFRAFLFQLQGINCKAFNEGTLAENKQLFREPSKRAMSGNQNSTCWTCEATRKEHIDFPLGKESGILPESALPKGKAAYVKEPAS